MLSLVLLPLLVAGGAADTDYCNIASCVSAFVTSEDHTLCKFPANQTASRCGTVVERGVSSEDQDEILEAHNAIRRDVKNGVYADKNLPAAREMPELKWDEELATVAQRWVDQCQGGHDKCRNVPRFYVGQNYAASWGYPKNWASNAVGQWFFKELPLFQQQDLTFTFGTGTGHLTQVIWAETTRVGCGFIAVEDTQIVPGYTLVKRTYICNYGPGGNIMVNGVGKQIYYAA
ncbi:venom allergen 5-like [Amphibalanus amphitrite]|nr:venom allergen 5-like [Amphibalanus amphitrite]